VQAILSKLHAEGHFYKEIYSGFYSTKEETFLTEKDRRPDGTFDPAYGEVIELEEENYNFNLKNHQQWLIDFIESNPDFVSPDNRRNEVLGFLKNNVLEDLCISRPAARLNWGIPLPFDSNYVTYVWFDALVNYASIPAALGDPNVLSALPSPVTRHSSLQLWPADIHVIGKDILKFHAVFWPIMLKVIGLPLPKQILVHGWWQKDGQKMSKTTGNVVDPVAVIDEWGVDAFRFYVLRELDIGPDGNWTDAGFRARYAAELANGLGNLVNRSLSMLKRYRNGIVPGNPLTRSSTTLSPSDGVGGLSAQQLASEATKVVNETRALLEQNQLQSALQTIWSLIARANQYVDKTAPFKLAKDPAQAKRLDEVLYNLAELCRILAVLLWPFLPGTATKLYAQLGMSGTPDKFSGANWGGLGAGHTIGEPSPLFPRKDV
jgi:methionyl-tRNA synthetase